jgi:hypothetical protein
MEADNRLGCRVSTVRLSPPDDPSSRQLSRELRQGAWMLGHVGSATFKSNVDLARFSVTFKKRPAP